MNINEHEVDILDYLSKCFLEDKYRAEIEAKLPEIISYVSCVIEWNKAHNIVSRRLGINDLLESVIDSIMGGYFLTLSKNIYDAGSGGGFPGFLLAIMYPESLFTLVEANRKKCSFLLSSKAKLKLKNVEVAQLRIESLNELPYIITKAAFSPANIGVLAKVLAKEGKIAIWTTPKDQKALKEVLCGAGLDFKASHTYCLPGSKERVILEFIKRA